LAVIRSAFMLDHCVAVLGVSDTTVTIADPIAGIESMPCEKFASIWRFSGIVLSRKGAVAGSPAASHSLL
jgi:predicted double-glycine peptidase